MPGLDPATLIATWEGGLAEDDLARAVRLLAAAAGISHQEAAGWDVGSRDAVLAGLLTGDAGRMVWTRAGCGGCGGLLDVPVDLVGIAATPVGKPGAVRAVETAGGTVRFRLPTTADLRDLRDTEPGTARQRLLERCLLDPLPDSGAAPAAAVEAAMERACPHGAVSIGVRCPDCGSATSTALDVPALAWAELEARAVALLAEVHALATAYGWPEPAVLAMSPQRRAAYLELVGS